MAGLKVIFGGAFNPVHREHINMIKSLLSLDEVEKVILLPSDNPPHKRCETAYDSRLEMLKIATSGLESVEICEYERGSEGKSYTCEVLPKLKEIYGDVAFAIGGDSLVDLDKWKNPQDIIRICPIYIFSRGDKTEFARALDYWRARGGDLRVCDYEPSGVSSTVVRCDAKLGEYSDLDGGVADYIKRNGLYGEFSGLLAKLEADIPSNTYAHCIRTAMYAARANYALALGLDNDKVLLAGALHDCAKALCKVPHDASSAPSDSVGTPVEHQFIGAATARERYGIEDEDVLETIKYHTTGKRGMSVLQKLIFCSDMLESGRDYPEVNYLRGCMKKSLDYCYEECALAQYEFLLGKGGDIYPLTVEAIEEIKERRSDPSRRI